MNARWGYIIYAKGQTIHVKGSNEKVYRWYFRELKEGTMVKARLEELVIMQNDPFVHDARYFPYILDEFNLVYVITKISCNMKWQNYSYIG